MQISIDDLTHLPGIIGDIARLESDKQTAEYHRDQYKRQLDAIQDEKHDQEKKEYFRDSFHKVAFDKFEQMLIAKVGPSKTDMITKMKRHAYEYARCEFAVNHGGKKRQRP